MAKKLLLKKPIVPNAFEYVKCEKGLKKEGSALTALYLRTDFPLFTHFHNPIQPSTYPAAIIFSFFFFCLQTMPFLIRATHGKAPTESRADARTKKKYNKNTTIITTYHHHICFLAHKKFSLNHSSFNFKNDRLTAGEMASASSIVRSNIGIV